MAPDEIPGQDAGGEESPPAPRGPICRHIRHNGMLIYTAAPPPDMDEDDPKYDTTIFWCGQTTKGWGPDDGDVSLRECKNTGRPCYEPF